MSEDQNRKHAHTRSNQSQSTAQSRYDPFLDEWVIYAPTRNKRPFQGKKFENESSHTSKKTWTCPFCPDAPEGAGHWVVKQLGNKYASLDEHAMEFSPMITGERFSYQKASNYGKCEVILYSQEHNASFGTLTQSNIVALIKLWQERYLALAQIPTMQYPFIMENRGKEIGNSMTHPHGQIFSFPYLPPKIKREFNAVKKYHEEKDGRCLHCDIIKEEIRDKRRIIEENESFIAEIPYYAHWAFEIHIIAKRHCSSIDELSEQEISDLAIIMSCVVRRYDILRGNGELMPYVMAMHNAPVNVPDRNLWHFHIEFYTPFRGSGKWKFLAGVELGLNTFISDALPESNARIMRDLSID
ncbi:MAG: galactose-1-phosphate uridylyltransferase [Promethearchaeota archaeon]